jgi:selenocysteine lyase/cysteine desulfurase
MTLDLREHFAIFRNAAPGRIHLAAHSHHFWPDAACAAHGRLIAETAKRADHKWDAIFGTLIPRAQRGIAALLQLPDPATIAFAPNTHEFVVRLVSSLPLGRPLYVLTTDSEFHSFARQAARIEEDGVVVERIRTEPFATFPARFAEATARGGHDLVYVSQVFFNSAATAGTLDALVAAVPDPETLIAIDGYHGYMALPTDLSGIAGRAFYLAGGYKYAMAGEGAGFMHCPPGYAPRPRATGWFAAFGALTAPQDGRVAYGSDGSRFMGATFDPSGLTRFAAVLDWMDAIGLTVAAIHDHALALAELFVREIADQNVAPLTQARLVTPMAANAPRGNFLTFETPRANDIHTRLAAADIVTDVRGERIRFGFGCYHAAEDIAPAVAAIARALANGE